MNDQLKTAVLFLVFNRLDTTKRIFETIRQAKPSRLYVAADGPRADRADENEKVRNVRDYIIKNIDWECDVKTLFRNENLGCKMAVSSAINWFFENEEMGIILEDDCLVDLSFFSYCQELLTYYYDNPRIMMISGDNFQDGKKRGAYSYYFSRFSHIWGWATWKRAWDLYDLNLSAFEDFKIKNKIKQIFNNKRAQKYWLTTFDDFYNKPIDTWDFQWLFTVWNYDGITIIPNNNLVSNIGFGEDGLHTKDTSSKSSNMPVRKIIFPLKHPHYIEIDNKADIYTHYKQYDLPFYEVFWNTLCKYLQIRLLKISCSRSRSK